MIEVINPGFYTTIQDRGRYDYVHLGVPISGAMDKISADRANALVGNPSGMALFEMTMVGATLKFNTETTIAVAGSITQVLINNIPFGVDSIMKVNHGDEVTLGRLTGGFRCYLAVAGGVVSEIKLGSQAMYPGITTHHRILKGQVFDIGKLENIQYYEINGYKSEVEDLHLMVYKGPEYSGLTVKERKLLFNTYFEVSKNNNRMAYQLEDTLENSLEPILTAPVIPGTIQLTPSGKIIILMRDCQTTGGYPRILQLSEHSKSVLAQKTTGDKFQFSLIEY